MNTDVVLTAQRLLEKNFPILVYNGQNDVIVCTPCAANSWDNIPFSGNKDFKN